MKDIEGKYWRLSPGGLYCKVIVENRPEMDWLAPWCRFLAKRDYMNSYKKIFITIIILSLVGCSNGPVEVVDSSWRCEKRNNARECDVYYTIKNNDDFVREATVKVRAHRRRRIEDAVSNEVVGENTIMVKLAPKEQKKLKHIMTLKYKLTQIVVSAYIAK